MPRWSPLPALLGLAACGVAPTNGDLVVTDASNGRLAVSHRTPMVQLARGADIEVDWSAVTTDLRGVALSGPDAVRAVRLVEHRGEPDGDPDGDDDTVLAIWEYENTDGATSCTFTDLGGAGRAFDPDDRELGFTMRDGSEWELTIWRWSDALQADVLVSTAHLFPSERSDVTTLAFDDDTASQSVRGDLRAPEAIEITGGIPTYTLDWSGLTVGTTGAPFAPRSGGRLVIAHDGEGSPAAKDGSSLLAQLEAADTWTLDVRGRRHAVLRQATSPVDGSPFPGFTSDGAWLVALLDPTGADPAPALLISPTVW